MTCIPIVQGKKQVGFVCVAPGETGPLPGKRRRRLWCFGCRKRQLHTLMVFEPGPESYYGPTFWHECPTCHADHTSFPGQCG